MVGLVWFGVYLSFVFRSDERTWCSFQSHADAAARLASNDDVITPAQLCAAAQPSHRTTPAAVPSTSSRRGRWKRSAALAWQSRVCWRANVVSTARDESCVCSSDASACSRAAVWCTPSTSSISSTASTSSTYSKFSTASAATTSECFFETAS